MKNISPIGQFILPALAIALLAAGLALSPAGIARADPIQISDTTAHLAASQAQVGVGQPVTFTVIISAGALPPIIPMRVDGGICGTVTFKDGAENLETGQLTGGVLSFTTALAAGKHTITAEYSGDSGHNPSVSDGVPLVVEYRAYIPFLW